MCFGHMSEPDKSFYNYPIHYIPRMLKKIPYSEVAELDADFRDIKEYPIEHWNWENLGDVNNWVPKLKSVGSTLSPKVYLEIYQGKCGK